MKRVRIRFPEGLLERLDSDELVRRLGRSEVMRRNVEAFLRARESQKMEGEHAGGFGPDFPPIREELDRWTESVAPSRDP